MKLYVKIQNKVIGILKVEKQVFWFLLPLQQVQGKQESIES